MQLDQSKWRCVECAHDLLSIVELSSSFLEVVLIISALVGLAYDQLACTNGDDRIGRQLHMFSANLLVNISHGKLGKGLHVLSLA